LYVEGSWEAPGPVGNFKVSGRLGGKKVAVLVTQAVPAKSILIGAADK